jgi:ubiquinone/menaquinone biosynthesis C-methylase UbiE
MEKEQARAAYNLWHQHRAVEEASQQDVLYPWHRTVARLLPDLNGARVLEIGCGRGDFSLWLARKYPLAAITGIDFSNSAIAVASAKPSSHNLNVRFLVDDAENLSFPADIFDHIISCECLEHVPQPEKMAHEMARVLKPGGRFILTTENYFNGMLLAWLNSWLRGKPLDSGSGLQPIEHFFLWWRVKKILERSGLRVEHMESNHFQWLLLPRTAPSKLCTEDFGSAFLKAFFLPFGRHFTFWGSRA